MPHYCVTIEVVMEVHELVFTFGGAPGIVNHSSILSAIGRPYNGYYRSIHRKAAALLESMAKNHGFVDGNKRTTLLIVTLFLNRSGYGLGDVDEQLNEDLSRSSNINNKLEFPVIGASQSEIIPPKNTQPQNENNSKSHLNRGTDLL